MVERHGPWPSNEQLAWTPRQRQVLELVTRGRTNAEIADELGVSLGGAKWHVSEVLSKLGVASREEAACYWREQRRVGRRVGRLARGIAGLLPLKVVAGTAALAAVAGGLALAIGMTQPAGRAGGNSAVTASATSHEGPIYTNAQALHRAIYLAGLYLKQTDLPQTTQISGHLLQVSDLTLVGSDYMPPSKDATARVGAPDNGGKGTWKFKWERAGVTIPGPAGPPIPGSDADGIVTLDVTFLDGTGKIVSASAGKSEPAGAVQPTPAPMPDTSLQEPVTMAFPVATLGAGGDTRSLGLYETRGGDWCWSETDWIGGNATATCPVAPSADAEHIFGVTQSGAMVIDAKRLPVTLYGAVSADVDRVELIPATGDAVAATLVSLPVKAGLPYRAFFTEMGDTTGSSVTVEAFAADGTILERSEVSVRPSEFESTDGVVKPLSPISFSGTGDLHGGYFELPPPAFPVKLDLTTTYDGDGPITVDLVCDTGTVRIINQAGRDGDANGSLIVDIPPEATHCSFDVWTDGWWSIRST